MKEDRSDPLTLVFQYVACILCVNLLKWLYDSRHQEPTIVGEVCKTRIGIKVIAIIIVLTCFLTKLLWKVTSRIQAMRVAEPEERRLTLLS